MSSANIHPNDQISIPRSKYLGCLYKLYKEYMYIVEIKYTNKI